MNEWTCLAIVGVAAVFGILVGLFVFRDTRRQNHESMQQIAQMNRLLDEMDRRMKEDKLVEDKKEKP